MISSPALVASPPLVATRPHTARGGTSATPSRSVTRGRFLFHEQALQQRLAHHPDLDEAVCLLRTVRKAGAATGRQCPSPAKSRPPLFIEVDHVAHLNLLVSLKPSGTAVPRGGISFRAERKHADG